MDFHAGSCCAAPIVEHHHDRGWRPCPALYPPPLRPRKPAAIFMFAFAEAIQHDVTFIRFALDHPREFAGIVEAER